MLPPGAILELKTHQNAFVAGGGGFAPDPIGEVYSAPPEPLLVSKEPLRGRGWVEKRGGEEEKEGSIPTSFLQFNN